MDADLLKEFLWSTRDDLDAFEQTLLQLESGTSADPVDDAHQLYRFCHSLKGAAGLLQLPALEHAVHSCEALFGDSGDQRQLDTDAIAMLYVFADGVKQCLQVLERDQQEDALTFQAFLDLAQDLGGATSPPAPPARTGTGGPPPADDVSSAPPTTMNAPPAVKAAPTAAAAPAPNANHVPTAEGAIRVNVGLIDKLMNLVGELVLTRNRLLQMTGDDAQPALHATAQALDQVTSELQDSIMRTRMQPVSSVFGKFPRIVRDLAGQLGKDVHLEMNGQETELDRTILESMRDPFTHLLRNSLDHGLETAAERQAAGKPGTGTVTLSAWHEGGHVIVEIRDDGRGIDTGRVKDKAIEAGLITPERAASMSDNEACLLICHPGLSTAAAVTNISGRGVGMDVVRSNIEAIGGSLDINSEPGRGTCLRITIPLTLAIIPALIVECQGRQFGIPQINLVELVGLQPQEVAQRVEQVRGAEVLRPRDQLLTLLRLHDLLGLPAPPPAPDAMQFVVVVAAGDQQFGLVVDGIQDTEEIVVKPLSHHLSGIAHYAGATIRGDGSVCLILDMAGIMRSARIAHEARHELHEQELQRPSEQQDFLVFTAGHDERFALPLQLVNRIEQHPRERVRRVNGTLVLCRDDQMLPLIRLEDHCTAASDSQSNDDSVHVIILQARGGMGLLARAVIDSMVIDVAHVLNDAGILGNRIIAGLSMVQGDPVSLIDAYALMDAAYPESRAPTTRESQAPLRARILYCEDAQFFQNVVGTYLREAGHSVTVVDDGRQGWEQLQQHAGDFDLLITDLEMPELNGWQLIQEVRTMPDLHSLPIIALTSLSDEQARQQSLQVGADEHVVKLQKDELHETVMRLLRSRQAVSS